MIGHNGGPPIDRDADLLGARRRDAEGRASNPIRRWLDKKFDDVAKGFEDQADRSDSQQDYWDCYNCVPNQNRYYNGIAQIYFPIIHDAIEARVTRFSNQMFPQSGRYVEAVTADGSTASAMVALIDHHIRDRRVKTQIVAPLLRNGDIEGQYNLYMDWAEVERQVVSRETHGPRDPETGMETPGDEMEDVIEEVVRVGMPVFEVLHDSDVLVWPPTVDSIEEALAGGGGCAIVRRWSKGKLKHLAKADVVRKDEAEDLEDAMGKVDPRQKDVERHLLDHVGIRKQGKEVQVWEVWLNIPLNDKGKFDEDKGIPRLCRVFFGPARAQLGAKRNPYWNDRCPLLSGPLLKTAGNFKGPSLISYVDSLQYEANDAANEGADAATLSAAPIVTRNTASYNGPLVYNVGAIWDIPPDDVKLLTFPDLTPRAQVRVQMAIAQIFQTLGVNPSMLPQQTRTGKPNQAQIAQEQAVDLLTTAEAVTIIEEGILTPAIGWVIDLDYQFRDHDLTVRMWGEMGKHAAMQQVAPLQNRNGLTFIWRGGNQVRQNAMMMQQGTAWLNVLRGIAPLLQAEGKLLHLSPIIEAQTQNIFGPELGALTIVDQRDQLTFGQDEENQMLLEGFEVPVHPLDNDEEHIPRVMQMIQMTGDPHGTGRVHLQAHLKQREAKTMAMKAMRLQQAIGMQGGGPGPQAPGAGMPQPGAAPAGPRLVKGPPGMIPPDQLPRAGAMVPPRRA